MQHCILLTFTKEFIQIPKFFCSKNTLHECVDDSNGSFTEEAKSVRSKSTTVAKAD